MANPSELKIVKWVCASREYVYDPAIGDIKYKLGKLLYEKKTFGPWQPNCAFQSPGSNTFLWGVAIPTSVVQNTANKIPREM